MSLVKQVSAVLVSGWNCSSHLVCLSLLVVSPLLHVCSEGDCSCPLCMCPWCSCVTHATIVTSDGIGIVLTPVCMLQNSTLYTRAHVLLRIRFMPTHFRLGKRIIQTAHLAPLHSGRRQSLGSQTMPGMSRKWTRHNHQPSGSSGLWLIQPQSTQRA